MPKLPSTPSPADLIQSEVITNILNQPLGTRTLADLNLPRDLLIRIADRIIRASFNERHRLVVASASKPLPEEGVGVGSPSPLSSAVHSDRCVTQGVASMTAEVSQSPSLSEGLGWVPIASDQPAQGDRVERSQQSLTPNLQILDRPLSPEALRVRQSLLESRPANRAFCAGDDPATFNSPTNLPSTDLATFKPTIPNFQLLPDDGTHQPRALRLQLTRGTDYAAPTDGGALDMLRHIAAALPTTPLFVSVERKHLADARAACEEFAAVRAAPITLLVEDLPVAQWAHDNAKPGLANAQPFSLLPRYASRGEDGSVFVPGESFLHENLIAAGIIARRSPLLFQGGNLLAFLAPHSNALTLLLGEAELARNTALGLSPDQALAAFQAEFGVSRVVLLPAISYHIDLEVSIRRLDDGTSIALLNDQPTAVRIILLAAIDALERARHVSSPHATTLRSLLHHGPMNEFLLKMWSNLALFSARPGHVFDSLATAFSTGPADSGVGNIHRVLLALDLLASELPLPPSLDPHASAVLASFARRQSERRRLRSQLQAIGLKTLSIPSLSDADRSINYLNGLHIPHTFLAPVYGGLFEPLDRAAFAAIQSALGPNVRVLPIPSAESQRREGALRCATAIVS